MSAIARPKSDAKPISTVVRIVIECWHGAVFVGMTNERILRRYFYGLLGVDAAFLRFFRESLRLGKGISPPFEVACVFFIS